MFVAGIDAHATYSVIAIVSNTGQLDQRANGSTGGPSASDEQPTRAMSNTADGRSRRMTVAGTWLGRPS